MGAAALSHGRGAAAEVDYSCVHSASWKLNSNGDTSSIFGGVATDVTSSSRSGATWSSTFNRIPNYDRIFSSADITTLNSRPEASSDFTAGVTSAAAGNTYVFGEDIGYASPGPSCSLGYWPPGPGCPTAATSTKSWDLNPAPETRADGCYLPVLGAQGYWVRHAHIDCGYRSATPLCPYIIYADVLHV
jgi:hypothetical protein